MQAWHRDFAAWQLRSDYKQATRLRQTRRTKRLMAASIAKSLENLANPGTMFRAETRPMLWILPDFYNCTRSGPQLRAGEPETAHRGKGNKFSARFSKDNYLVLPEYHDCVWTRLRVTVSAHLFYQGWNINDMLLAS